MEYSKPALTIEEQVDQLLDRGMVGTRDSMVRRLSVVSYYRLSGYWFHRKLSDDSFEPGTSFDVAWKQYMFDRKLRLLLMDAIERLEVGLRVQFCNHHALQHGPFGYATDSRSTPQLGAEQRLKLIAQIDREAQRSRELFVRHFRDKYGTSHRHLPLWMAIETMSLSCVIRLWQASSDSVKGPVAAAFGVSEKVLESWLWTLNEARNVCAHHGRLWNREFGIKPKIPRRYHHPEWHTPEPVPNHRVYAVLTISAYSLSRLAPNSTWQVRLRQLVEAFPDIPTKNMGFPDAWLSSPIWKGARDMR